MPATPVNIGEIIAGKYVVEGIIGDGGMGVVVAARHLELEQRVAIKFLLPEIAEQGQAAERFRREARAAARIRGEHVCRVLDVGTLENGVPYMVMEFLEGVDLATELERRDRVPYDEAIDYVLQACEGLAEAHAAGIVHRDLKPANLYLALRADGSRCIKVLDFGVSKSLLDGSGGAAALTQTSSLIGSPFYMSPEQLDSAKTVDARTDIWALGVVLYELLSGRPPFGGTTIPQLVNALLHDTPSPLSELGVRMPEALEAVVARALQKARRDRYQTVGELADALAPFAPARALIAVERVTRLLSRSELPRPPVRESDAPRRQSSGSGASAADKISTPMSWSSSAERARARSRRMMVGASLALLLLGLGAWFLMSKRAVAPEAVEKHGPDATGSERNAAVAAPALPAPQRAPDTLAAPDQPLPRGALTPPPDVAEDAAAAQKTQPEPAKNAPAPEANKAPSQPAAAAAATPRASKHAPRSEPAQSDRSRTNPVAGPPKEAAHSEGGANITDFGGRR